MPVGNEGLKSADERKKNRKTKHILNKETIKLSHKDINERKVNEECDISISKKRLKTGEEDTANEWKPKRKRTKKQKTAKGVELPSLDDSSGFKDAKEEGVIGKTIKLQDKDTIKNEKAMNRNTTDTGKGEKFDYNPMLNRLRSISDEEIAKKMIDKEIEAGRLGAKDIGNIIRKWRQMKNRKTTPKADLAQLNQFEGTLTELKEQINKLVKEGQMTRFEAGTVIKKWKTRETRRVGRQMEKMTGKVCLKCRQPGHKMVDCLKSGSEDAVDICFKCGSLEHAIYKCPRKDKVQGFPYATCFVCKKQGHLSRDCEENLNGIYPDGGCCNICKSNQHLIKDCPERVGRSIEEEKEYVVKNTSSRGGDDDDFEFEIEDKGVDENASLGDTEDIPKKVIPKKSISSKKKIVKF